MTSFAATGWVQENGEWFWYDRDGSRVEDEWKKSGNDWYWLDSEENGAMALDKLIEDDEEVMEAPMASRAAAEVTATTFVCFLIINALSFFFLKFLEIALLSNNFDFSFHFTTADNSPYRKLAAIRSKNRQFRGISKTITKP